MAGTRWTSMSSGNLARASDMNADLAWMEGALAPMNGGSTTTGVHDIGTTTALWRHGYFSGQIVCASISATTINVGTIAIATTAPSIPTANVLYRDNVPKAWVRYAATGAGEAIIDDFNIASITRSVEGQYFINFATVMANINYCVIGSAIETGVAARVLYPEGNFSTTTCLITTVNLAGTPADGNITDVLVFGAQ